MALTQISFLKTYGEVNKAMQKISSFKLHIILNIINDSCVCYRYALFCLNITKQVKETFSSKLESAKE